MTARPHIIGLTGSIGMGKTTTAQMFRARGVPVWDADQTVHELYAKNGAAVAPLSHLVPSSTAAGYVDRQSLKSEIAKNPDLLRQIENIVHPLVKDRRQAFLDTAIRANTSIVVFDIPLLFETKAEHTVDTIVVVSVQPRIQRDRVLARPGMTPELFETILEKQMPDDEKRAKADYVIETSTLENAEETVDTILTEIRAQR